jgi:hypothetical protein
MLNPTGTQQDQQLSTADRAGATPNQFNATTKQFNPDTQNNMGQTQYDQSIGQQNGLLGQYLADYKSKIDQGEPALNSAIQDASDYQSATKSTIAGIQGDNNLSLDTQGGRGQIVADRAAGQQAALQQKVQSLTATRGQNIDAYNAMLTANMPHFNGYVGINQMTGQPIDGSGGGSGGAAFSGGATDARATAGNTYQTNAQTLSGVSQMAQSLPGLIQQSGANPTDVNVLNSVINAYNSNTSGQYPQVQSAFNNIIAQYAKVLGPQKINSLLSSAKGQTMQSFVQMLDGQAQNVQSGLQSGGNNQGTNNNANSTSSGQWGF